MATARGKLMIETNRARRTLYMLAAIGAGAVHIVFCFIAPFELLIVIENLMTMICYVALVCFAAIVSFSLLRISLHK